MSDTDDVDKKIKKCSRVSFDKLARNDSCILLLLEIINHKCTGWYGYRGDLDNAKFAKIIMSTFGKIRA